MTRESSLLSAIQLRARDLDCHLQGLEVGPGDDAAVITLLSARSNPRIVVTTDQLIAGRHYVPGKTNPAHVAHKAIARSISDLAAMTADPLFGIATAAISDDIDDPDALCQAFHHAGIGLGLPIIGGDLAATSGPSVLTVTALGTLPTDAHAPLRSGAQTGDAVWVTGAVGDAFHSGRHLTFTPRIPEARWLRHTLGPRLHAMLDISDGLGRDAARIAEASAVRIELHAEAIPLHSPQQRPRDAARDGEDYELLFTTPTDITIPSPIPGTSTPCTRIGRVTDGAGCVLIDADGSHDITDAGWDHTL